MNYFGIEFNPFYILKIFTYILISAIFIIKMQSQIIKIDSLNLKDKIAGQKGNLKQQFLNQKLKVSGMTSIGYEYGLLNYSAYAKVPDQATILNGNIGLSYGLLPLKISYNYIANKNVSKLLNYFRVSFDRDQFSQQLEGYKKSIKDKYAQQKDSLKQLADVKQFKLNEQSYQLEQFGAIQNKLASDSAIISDSLTRLKSQIANADVLMKDMAVKEGTSLLATELEKQKKDSLFKLYQKYQVVFQNKQDSITKLLAEKENIEANIKSGQQSIDALKSSTLELEKILNSDSAVAQIAKQSLYKYIPASKYLDKIRQFEIGNINPRYSSNTLGGAPIRGVNMASEKGKIYYQVTAGFRQMILPVFNVFDSTKTQIPNLNKTFFKFDKSQFQNWLVATKFGIGNNEASHIHAVIMLTKDGNVIQNEASSKTNRMNAIVGLDMKQKMGKSDFIRLNVAHSAFINDFSGLGAITKEYKTLKAIIPYTSSELEYNGSLPWKNQQIKAALKYNGAFYKSLTAFNQRPDFFIGDIRWSIKLNKKISLKAQYKLDENNIFGNYNKKLRFQTISGTINWKIKRNIFWSNSVQYLVRNQNQTLIDSTLQPNVNIDSLNLINNLNGNLLFYQSFVTIQHKFFGKGMNHNFSFISSASLPIENKQFSISVNYSNLYNLSKSFDVKAMANYNERRIDKKTSSNLVYGALIYKAKKFNSELGAKLGTNEKKQSDWGFKATAQYLVNEHLQANLIVDKLLLSDYFNMANYITIKKNPYYISCNLQLLF
jgi:hypothetical protein